MSRYRVGDRVLHKEFWLGTVTAEEAKGRQAVAFDEHGERLIKPGSAPMRAVDAQEERSLRERDKESFERTFVFEDAAAQHYPASHWQPLHENFGEEVLKTLPVWIAQAGVATGLSSFNRYRAPPMHGDWPQAFKLRWPEQPDARHVVLRAEADGNQIQALMPVIDRGVQQSVVIDAVHVWENRVEAQVACTLGRSSLTFYDTDFVINAGWYRKGAPVEFIMSALAYACGPAEEASFEVPESSPLFAIMQAMQREAGGDPMAPRVNMRGGTVLIPVPDWDRDEYEFRGTVTASTPYEYLGQPGWMLSVRVMRDLDDHGRELVLKILVTRRVWKGEAPPKVGEDVGGALWLQGRLWQPNEDIGCRLGGGALAW